jgi:hypothetical protein
MELVLQTAPVYHLEADLPDIQRLQRRDRRTKKMVSARWSKWGWCKISDVLQLINRDYNLRWKKRDLLVRFALDRQAVDGNRYAETKPALAILTIGSKGGPVFTDYCSSMRSHLERSTFDFYVPAGWVKTVLWALHCGCTKFVVETQPGPDERPRPTVVAYTEEGQGIYLV